MGDLFIKYLTVVLAFASIPPAAVAADIKAHHSIPGVVILKGEEVRLPHGTAPVRLWSKAVDLSQKAMAHFQIDGADTAFELAFEAGKKRRDRYGRPIADVTANGISVTDHMIAMGALILDAGIAVPDHYRDAELGAMTAQKGLWALPALQPLPVTDLQTGLQTDQQTEWPTYQIDYYRVRGVILSRGETKSTWYLNFGTYWKTDFTITINRGLDRAVLAPVSPAALPAGRCIEARGWIAQKDGPWLDLKQARQISILPDDQCKQPQ